MKTKRKRKKKNRNPTPTTVAAIVVGSLGAIALGSLVVYAVRSGRRAGLPPAVKQPLPPRANGMPSPDPIAPAKVPATTTSAANQFAPKGDDWVTYGWYTYKGNAPQKMWIRVDWKGNALASVIDEDEGPVDIGPGSAIVHSWYIVGPLRWVVIMGADTPMATETLWDLKVDCSTPESILFPRILTGQYCRDARQEAETPDQKENFLREWIMPTAGSYAARSASDWIDVAYGG